MLLRSAAEEAFQERHQTGNHNHEQQDRADIAYKEEPHIVDLLVAESSVVGNRVDRIFLAPDPANDHSSAKRDQRIGKDADEVVIQAENILAKNPDITPHTKAQAYRNAKDQADHAAHD